MRKARLLKSFTFRSALLYAVLSLCAVALLFGFIYWSTAGYVDRQTEDIIEAEAQGLAEQYSRQGLTGLMDVIAERVSSETVGAAIYLLAREDFEPIVGNLDRWPDSPISDEGWTRFELRESAQGETEVHEVRAHAFELAQGLHLLVGRNMRDFEHMRWLLLDALAWGLVITAALALGIGLIMSARVAGRLEVINETSRDIMQGDLSRRVRGDGSGDEFDQLSTNLNVMLERIEGLMASVRHVSDNIAHDLRTPLTRLRTRLELARGEEGEQAEESIDEAIGDAEELMQTFNALLRIARLEEGSRRSDFKEVDLEPLVEGIAEIYGPVAAESNQRFQEDVLGQPVVRGDRDLLFQAFANLVDNAIKYTPDGGRITLRAEVKGDRAVVAVGDTGPGVPEELRGKVFERFFRIDDSRSTHGSGLGLSLVHAVAQLHDARVALRDNEPGLEITLSFKLA